MNDIFKENSNYMTQQGLKYLISNEIMNQIEKREAVNVLANIEMGVEGRLTLIRILVFLFYIYLACSSKLYIGHAMV